jgi:hypothetical protein
VTAGASCAITIKRHLHNIFTKLGVRSRTDALARAEGISLQRRNAGEVDLSADEYMLDVDQDRNSLPDYLHGHAVDLTAPFSGSAGCLQRL